MTRFVASRFRLSCSVSFRCHVTRARTRTYSHTHFTGPLNKPVQLRSALSPIIIIIIFIFFFFIVIITIFVVIIIIIFTTARAFLSLSRSLQLLFLPSNPLDFLRQPLLASVCCCSSTLSLLAVSSRRCRSSSSPSSWDFYI